MNNIDLSMPQRQSVKGLVILFAFVFYQFIRAFLPLLLIVFYRKRDTIPQVYIYAAVLLLIAVSLLISYLNYRFFTFRIAIETNEFIVQRGWINKTKTVIKLNKIQQVNLNQKLLHQLLNVYEVEVDTAGSQDIEVKIKAVSGKVAQQLKQQLLQQQDTVRETVLELPVQNEVPLRQFIRISFSSLVKVGLTRRYIQTFALLFVLMIQGLEQYRQYFANEQNEESIYTDVGNFASTNITGLLIPLFVLVVFVLVVIVNLSRTLLRYFNYKINIHENNLLISYGLLETKNTIIKPSRVQFLQVTQNYFQKILNVFELKIVQTESDTKDTKKGRGIDVPGVSFQEKEAILHQLFPKPVMLKNAIQPSIRKWIVHTIWFSIIPAFSLFFYGYYQKQEYAVIGAVFLLFITLLYQWVTYRNARMYWTDDFIVFRKGFWDVSYCIVEPHKIQKIETYQRFWHKDLDLGSVVLYTAGGTLTFTIADYTEIKKRVNYWLYQIESKNLNWM